MTRKECLDAAAGCVLQDRHKKHGRPEDCFEMIAGLWGAYLKSCISAHDVAAMMALLKIARFRHNPAHLDDAVDLAGYAACMAELATAWEREGGEECGGAVQDHDSLVQAFGPKAWKEPVQEAGDKPKFKVGDTVEACPLGSRHIWLPAVVEHVWDEGDEIHYRVKFSDGYMSPCPASHVRPASKKAEGCEELVFDEARMRESMPGIVPQDGPSDMDAMRPHCPTGEELAEMAEEKAHE